MSRNQVVARGLRVDSTTTTREHKQCNTPDTKRVGVTRNHLKPNVVVKERQACSLPLPVRIAVHRVTPTHASKATIWQKRRKESKSRKDLEQLEKDLRRKEITLQRIEREIEDFKLPKKETRAMAIITRKPKKNTKIRNRKISTRPCSNIYQHDSFKQRCMLNFYHCCCKFYCYLTILLIAAGFVLFVI
ncbi:unnamed protein product [Arctia plantaginis]|uniref:Uncharacterized protein n=1 Tax=Arctia plantaginis TaxID=874455 RepID=A0A8S1ALK1_ARCPL|nr:unnamed protein product [Arctia plantaginis]CAB3254922.1 unnamed protein product [Arctia plantaginis]